MACKTNGKPSRTKASRGVGARFEPFIRPLPASSVKAMRLDVGSVSLPRVEPSLNDIRKRAYFIYLARGGANGDANADWAQAERELREELNNSAQHGRRF